MTGFHAGQRVVLNIPNDGNNSRVQVRSIDPGPQGQPGAVMLQLRTYSSTDLLGLNGIQGAAEARINALSSLALGSGNGDFVGNVEVMRLTPGKQVGIGTSSPQAKLDVRVPAGPQPAMHISSDGAGAGDIPALRWRNASGDDKLAIMTNLGATPTARIKSAGTLALHAGSQAQGYGGENEFVTILANGNVGIGTTTPGARLDVNGDIKVALGLTSAKPIAANGLGNDGRIEARQFYALIGSGSTGKRIADENGCYYA